MKKKLLAVILSVIMIAALMVPMFAVSAADTADLKIEFGTIEIAEDEFFSGKLAVPIFVTENEIDMYAINFQILCDKEIEPYVIPAAQMGTEEDFPAFIPEFTNKVGMLTVGFSSTTGTNPNDTDLDGFQIVLDSGNANVGLTGTGLLGTAYFNAPTTPGTYTFTIRWITGTTSTIGVTHVLVNDGVSATYTIDCSHPVDKQTTTTVPAKCGVKGSTTVTCDVCDETLSSSEIPALEHNFSVTLPGTSAGCTTPGTAVLGCANEGCNETKTTEVAALGHDFSEKVSETPAECGKDGKIVWGCSRCDETDEEVLPALDHDFSEKVSETPAECGKDGKIVWGCANDCGETEDEIIPALVHDFSEKISETPATCDQDGKIVWGCANDCGETEDEVLPATGHDLSKFEITKEPTATEEGAKTLYCVNEDCQYSKDVVIPKLTDKVVIEEILSIESADKNLPSDLTVATPDFDSEDVEQEGKEIVTGFKFYTEELNKLEGKANAAFDLAVLAEEFDKFSIVKVDADGTMTEVKTVVDGTVYKFEADLGASYVVYGIPTVDAPVGGDVATGDSLSVVFVITGILALAGIVFAAKKRFAL